jgi:tetratricopeptide (TPR) repeat protein
MLAPMVAIAEAAQALERADEALARLDVDAHVAHLSAAVRGFTDAGDVKRAALACARLGDAMSTMLGNRPAARAWFARATRLLADEPPCVEQGWVAVAGMGCEVDDPAELLAAAELALDRARRFGDVELETKALADGGLALVQSGRIAEGMAWLDEAMALACGPVPIGLPVAASVCSFFTACYHAADFERADSWAELLRRHGLIGRAAGAPAYLSSHCDAVHATLLVELGRWGDAELVLEQACADFRAVMSPLQPWHPEIALADLRMRQARFTEAEELLLGKDQFVQALLPAARLHLERGDPDLACAAARRGLRGLRDDRLRAAELLTVLVDAELARGDVDAAMAASADLAARTADVDVAALRARAACAQARAHAARGDEAGAVALLEDALDQLDPARLPWARATTLVALARAREATGDRAGATLDARAAREILRDLDAMLPPAERELLAGLLDERATRPRTAVLARDGSWWSVSCDGTVARVPDSKGLRYLAELVREPGRERHALDLVDHVEGVERGIDRRSLGDAGRVADAAARTAYRRRIEELRAELDEALELGHDERAARCQEEIERLVGQLARAFGLGGRDRREASAAERARLNVTRALRAATARLAQALPAAASLDRDLRTGMYCCYEPQDDDVRWIVQSALNDPPAD